MAPNLLKLLADNRTKPRRFEASATDSEATLYLYDAIVSDEMTAEWFGGVAPEPFAKALNAITAPTIHLRINSPGGDVFGARAIEQAIRAHPSNIIAHIDGVAASAATFVAIAADQVEISPGALFMVHNSWTLAFGNADDLMNTAALLEKIDGTIADSYAKRTGTDLAAVKALMDAETWMTGEEAVAAGFADRLAEDAPKASASWDMSVYAKAPTVEGAQAPSEAQAAAIAPAPVAEVVAVEPIVQPNTDELRRRLDLVARTA